MESKNHRIYFGNGDNALAEDIIMNEHCTLIAGSLESDKSLLVYDILKAIDELNGLDPSSAYLIDFEGFELSRYKDFPWCYEYASHIRVILRLVRSLSETIDIRFKNMKKNKQFECKECRTYLIINELAFLSPYIEKNEQLKDIKYNIEYYLEKIASLGNAANIHIIACTQFPVETVIAPLAKQFTTRVGLKTTSAQESVNIIGQEGCELLPESGVCYYKSPKYGFKKMYVPFKEEYENHPFLGPYKSSTKDPETYTIEHTDKKKASFKDMLTSLSRFF